MTTSIYRFASKILAALRVTSTPTDALRRPVAPSVPEGPQPLTDSEKRNVRDFARGMMYSELAHFKFSRWTDENIRRYVVFGLKAHGITTATETEVEEIRGLVPWERR